MTKYKDLKAGDVLQAGDEKLWDNGDGYKEIPCWAYGAIVEQFVPAKFRRPIVEVCDHVVGVDMPDKVIGLLLRKKRASIHYLDDPDVTWFKHCPDCGEIIRPEFNGGDE